MNIKAVVKVMNFQALIRVDSARRIAEKYSAMEEEVTRMLKLILSNRILQQDKLLELPDPSKPVLKIYIGSDFGFCGSVNSSVSAAVKRQSGGNSVVIGKKLRKNRGADVCITIADIEQEFSEVYAYLEKAVNENCWSAIDVVYNHYFNSSSIKFTEKRIYPMELDTKDSGRDYIVEGDAKSMIKRMMLSCLCYEVKIAIASSVASENILRQNTTQESLKKLDELEEAELFDKRRRATQAAVEKAVDNFTKQKLVAR